METYLQISLEYLFYLFSESLQFSGSLLPEILFLVMFPVGQLLLTKLHRHLVDAPAKEKQ
jgi:hypothetical protein